ncbi:MAG: hypothetical protein CR974_03130 [Gammaproteobacteria bacterium]|nr:MAG: hypothetical protein CR974_03130 [Gammaproteobacteria bacterium]
MDLSTYGLERVKLSESIALDEENTELDPANANPRGAYNAEEDISPLDSIVNDFNKKWFEGWNKTPDEIRERPDFVHKVANNPDKQNSDLAFKEMLEDAMRERRDSEMDMFKLYKTDTAFYRAFFDTMRRVVENEVSV